MGCDIHMMTETRRSIDKEIKWVNSDHWVINHYFEERGDEPNFQVAELCGDRNYGLFAALANVRNYHDNPFLSEPRGLPDNASPETIEHSEGWGSDGHSHSWATLAELREFAQKHKKVKRGGMVTPEQAKALDEDGIEPEWWCLMTTNKEAVERHWESDFRNLDELILKMEERLREVFWLYGEYDISKDNDIRIVFWFDN